MIEEMPKEIPYDQIDRLKATRAHDDEQRPTHGDSQELDELLENGSNKDKRTAVARSRWNNASGAFGAIALGLIPLYFIVFAAKALLADGSPAQSKEASWLLQAALFVCRSRAHFQGFCVDEL